MFSVTVARDALNHRLQQPGFVVDDNARLIFEILEGYALGRSTDEKNTDLAINYLLNLLSVGNQDVRILSFNILFKLENTNKLRRRQLQVLANHANMPVNRDIAMEARLHALNT